MQVITNYYNRDGQIVQASPEMDSRDFYQNVLGTHAFSEMFRSANMDMGFGYKLTGGGVYLLPGGVSGLTKPSFVERYLIPTHQTGPATWYPEHWNRLDGKIAPASAFDGTLCTSFFGSRYIWLDMPSDKKIGLSSLKIQFSAVGGGDDAGLYVELKNSASNGYYSSCSLQGQWCTNPEWTGAGGYGAGVESTINDYSWYMPSVYDWGNPFCRDNQWHTFMATFSVNGTIDFYIDSVHVKSRSMSEYTVYDGTQSLKIQASVDDNSYLFVRDVSIEVV